MSRRVLLVDEDVDSLGAWASALRSRGLAVSNATEVFEAVELAYELRPDALLVSEKLNREGELTDAVRVVPELVQTPVFQLPDYGARASVPPSIIEAIVTKVAEASPRADTDLPVQDIRGDIEQMPLVDLLQLLTMNRRSGVLKITTSFGAGEIRLDGGDVADAIFRRLEGEKAFYRLLGEKDGHFTFVPGTVRGPRRIATPTSGLLMEAMRQVDETARRRGEITPSGEALIVHESSGELARAQEPEELDWEVVELPPLLRELMDRLQTPHTLDELLDEQPAPDLEVLEAVAELLRRKKVRRIPRASVTTPLASAEQLPVLRSLVGRLSRSGFEGAPRIVFAASHRRMPALAHAFRRIRDTSIPGEAPPRAGVPRLLATIRLGDGVKVSVLGLPGDESLSPVWSLFLNGAIAVVRMHEAGGDALAQHCEIAEVQLVEAESVMGELDVADAEQIAALIRAALETAAGV